MEVYPALDLYEEKVVRLERGDYQKCTVYSKNPVDTAMKWADQGARWIHIVDLEGAKTGTIRNSRPLKKILSQVKISVQFGGGLRTLGDIERLLELGVRRVILGTKALDPPFLRQVTEAHAGRIALSLDVKGEEVQIEGWLKGAGKSILDLFQEIKSCLLDRLVITDIERDGMLEGVNLTKMAKLLESSPFPVIASGGISSLDDIRALASLKSRQLDGVIVGKALYEGRLELGDALRIAEGDEVNP